MIVVFAAIVHLHKQEDIVRDIERLSNNQYYTIPDCIQVTRVGNTDTWKEVIGDIGDEESC